MSGEGPPPLSPALAALLRLARGLELGTLHVRLPGGRWRSFRGPQAGPEAVLVLRSGRLARRFLLGGSIGFGESYVDGDWDSPDLATLLELLDRNHDIWSRRHRAAPLLRLARLGHLLRPNSRRGSRRNVHAHYDLGNEFFAAWLDPTMSYSAARFADGAEELEPAQLAKYRHLARLMALGPGQRLLEVGSGWGAFAILAATEFGARVRSITISKAQQEWAARRVHELGLAERVEIALCDYRDVQGRYDRIASIEMLEAVGEAFWPTYFARLRDALLPGGMAGLQVITIADRHFAAYRKGCDFIQRYVFPGGMLPSPEALEAEIARAGLLCRERHRFGPCYARTLSLWRERFTAAGARIAGQGFDDRFRRLWAYYLAYCEAGFRTGSTDVVQVALCRP
jgi:cyclopropane-fatty-acyl-phospholipid synthase